MSTRSQSFLLQSFTEFYRLVAGIKNMVIELENAPDDEQPQGAEYERLTPKAIADRLLMVLDRQATQLSGPLTSPSGRLYQEARYVMVSLADEIFLDLNWSGKDEWRDNLLEEQVFHSQGSGELLFRKLDKLLVEPGAGQVDLAKVFLMALALGFKGKYRLSDPEKKLSVYMNRLYIIIFKRDPQLFEKEAQAFPQNYQYVLSKGDDKWLPTTHRWRKILMYALLTGVVITHILWIYITGSIDDIVSEILRFRT